MLILYNIHNEKGGETTCMFKNDCINTTAASIESVDIQSFLTQIDEWQRSLNIQDNGDLVIISVLDSVLDIFFDCCEFI